MTNRTAGQGATPALPRLYQAEWCDESHQVREWATDHLLDYHLVNVPREREQRDALFAATGQRGIPALVDGDTIVAGPDEIIAYWQERLGGESSR